MYSYCHSISLYSVMNFSILHPLIAHCGTFIQIILFNNAPPSRCVHNNLRLKLALTYAILTS